MGGEAGGVYVPCLVPLQVVCSEYQGKFVVVGTVLFCFLSAVLVTMEKYNHMIWLCIFTSSFFFFFIDKGG